MEDRVSSHSSCSTCTKCQKVCMRSLWCCRGAAGDDSLWWCHCFFCFVFNSFARRARSKLRKATFLRPHGNPWNFLFSCLPLSLTDAFALFSFLPLLSLLARVNLHHVFFNRDWGGGGDRALVEACEPDTTVNLHFHSVILSRPSSSSFSPFLCHSFFLLACHTLDKLEIKLS